MRREIATLTAHMVSALLERRCEEHAELGRRNARDRANSVTSVSFCLDEAYVTRMYSNLRVCAIGTRAARFRSFYPNVRARSYTPAPVSFRFSEQACQIRPSEDGRLLVWGERRTRYSRANANLTPDESRALYKKIAIWCGSDTGAKREIRFHRQKLKTARGIAKDGKPPRRARTCLRPKSSSLEIDASLLPCAIVLTINAGNSNLPRMSSRWETDVRRGRLSLLSVII